MTRIFIYFPLLFLFQTGGLAAQNLNQLFHFNTGSDSSKPNMPLTPHWQEEEFLDVSTMYKLDKLAPDTQTLDNNLIRIRQKLALFDKVLNSIPEGLTIRTLLDLKSEIANVKADISDERGAIRYFNQLLLQKSVQLLDAQRNIESFREKADSSLKIIYEPEFYQLLSQIRDDQEAINHRLKIYALRELDWVRLRKVSDDLYTRVDNDLSLDEAKLFRSELPPIWKSGPSAYRVNFFEGIGQGFQRLAALAKYYVSNIEWSEVLPRIILFLIFILPIYYFSRKKIPEIELEEMQLFYLNRQPAMVSLIMGLSASPVLFLNAPHSVLQTIFLITAVIVVWFTLKYYQGIDKKLFKWIILPYFLLFFINFFVLPTFLGRLIFAGSIFLLIPLTIFYKNLTTYSLKNMGVIRFFLIFLMIHIFVGWIYIIAGSYILGKSIVLAAYNLVILTMVFRIALFTFLDYVHLMAHTINEKSRSIYIHYFAFEKILRPFLFLCVIFFLSVSYLTNLNAIESVRTALSLMLTREHSINNVQFTYGNIILFLLAIYIASVVAELLRVTFDQRTGSRTDFKRTRFGGYVLLLRLLAICFGFFIAIAISGIPMSTFTIIFGALSVGIGFGLQNLVGNIISGIFIAFEKPFILGDTLEYNNNVGRVKEIGLRATRLVSDDQADIIVPNGSLMAQILKNWTYSNDQKSVSMIVPIDHAENPEKIEGLIRKAIDQQSNIVNKERASILLNEITDKGTMYKIAFTVDNLNNADRIKGEVFNKLYVLFQENKVKFAEGASSRIFLNTKDIEKPT